MPRVLLVLHEDTLGGASRALLRPVEILQERGWDVSIWCNRPSPLYDELRRLGHAVDGAPRLMRYRVRSLRDPPGVRARLGSLPRSLGAFRRHLREQRPDLVHVNGRLALPEALVARATGQRVVVFILDDALPGVRGTLGRVVPWMAAHEVIAASRRHGESLRLGPREPLIVFANAPVPAEELRPPSLRQRVVVGTIGVVVPRKGTDLFVDMAERLRAQGVDLDLRIAGGLEESHLAEWGRAQLHRAEAAGVRWLGQTDVARELREWDVMVMPSRADPFPLAVLEAMGAGVPVVGTRVDGIPEQLADGAGVLVPPEDPDALAAAVRALAVDPDRRAEIAARAHRRVRERFTLERSADALEAAWSAAAARGPAPGT